MEEQTYTQEPTSWNDSVRVRVERHEALANSFCFWIHLVQDYSFSMKAIQNQKQVDVIFPCSPDKLKVMISSATDLNMI